MSNEFRDVSRAALALGRETLAQIRREVDTALAEGLSFEEFDAAVRKILCKGECDRKLTVNDANLTESDRNLTADLPGECE